MISYKNNHVPVAVKPVIVISFSYTNNKIFFCVCYSLNSILLHCMEYEV